MTHKNYILAFIFLFFLPQLSFAGEREMHSIHLSPHTDRILILAPHPDDETLGAGGVIQEAVQENIPLKVVYLTNGDNNQLSFMMDQKRLVLRKKAVLQMGERRAREAVQGMESLGVTREQLVFLGYPDWGTEKIFTSFWGNRRPFKGLLTRTRHVPYADALSTGAPYLGDNILQDLKHVIADFKPTKIFVSHPFDAHRDHRAFFLYLQIALWDLKERIPDPHVYGYLVHWRRWPLSPGYHPQSTTVPPNDWPAEQTSWYSFDLDDKQVERKREAIDFYKTQTRARAAFLHSFARKNELFAAIDPEDLSRPGSSPFSLENSASYARDSEFIYITVKSSHLGKDMGKAQMFFIGYKNGVPFSAMPKIRVDIEGEGQRNTIAIYEKNKNIHVPGASAETRIRKREIRIKLPIDLFQNPDYLLTSLQTSIPNLGIKRGWRLLRLTNPNHEIAHLPPYE